MDVSESGPGEGEGVRRAVIEENLDWRTRKGRGSRKGGTCDDE